MRLYQPKYLYEAIVNNPAFVAKDITGDGKAETFCNWGLQLLAESLWNYKGFAGKRANDIVQFVQTSKDWKEVDGNEAHSAAGAGKLVIAGIAVQGGTGHVCLICDDNMVFSSKWGKAVPVCVNVGRNNFIKGVNWAFATEPNYYVYSGHGI
jgi:hypothetical protein